VELLLLLLLLMPPGLDIKVVSGAVFGGVRAAAAVVCRSKEMKHVTARHMQ
jgi:hypothetical protein